MKTVIIHHITTLRTERTQMGTQVGSLALSLKVRGERPEDISTVDLGTYSHTRAH